MRVEKHAADNVGVGRLRVADHIAIVLRRVLEQLPTCRLHHLTTTIHYLQVPGVFSVR